MEFGGREGSSDGRKEVAVISGEIGGRMVEQRGGQPRRRLTVAEVVVCGAEGVWWWSWWLDDSLKMEAWEVDFLGT